LSNDSEEKELIQTIIQVINEENPETVEQLVNRIREKSSFSEKQITTTILKLQRDGKIKLAKNYQLTTSKTAA